MVGLLLLRDPIIRLEYDLIYMVTDRFTKYAYIVPVLGTIDADIIAQLFLRTIFANHGTLDEVILDRDKLFTSKFYKTFIVLIRIKQKILIAFYP